MQSYTRKVKQPNIPPSPPLDNTTEIQVAYATMWQVKFKALSAFELSAYLPPKAYLQQIAYNHLQFVV